MKNYKIYYFAYGSNLNHEQMKLRCPDSRYIGTAELPNYLMVFRGNFRGNGVANIEEFDGFSVSGCVWEISENDEANLDKYEGFPHLYQKIYKMVEVNGKSFLVMIYVINKGFSIVAPGDEYLNIIRTGYSDCGLPLEKLSLAEIVTYDLE